MLKKHTDDYINFILTYDDYLAGLDDNVKTHGALSESFIICK